jgi:hypothetical protein
MTDRSRFDSNYSKTLIVSSNAGDGNVVELWGDPTTHALKVDASISVDAGFNLQQVGGANIALGQALATASLPVVLTAAQLTTLTPPSNTGYALDSSLATIDTDLKSNITLHAGNNVIGHVITDTGSTTVVTGTVTVSGSVTANAGTNLNTSALALETGGNLATLAGTVSASKVQVNVTNASIPVTGTFFQATQPVSLTTLPALTTGAALIGQVELTDGTNIAGVLAPGTANSTGNAQLIGGTTNTITFTTTSAQAVASTDVGNYAYFSFFLNTQGTNSVNTIQFSDDNTTWANGLGISITAIANSWSTTNNTAGQIVSGPIQGRYFRINVTAISAGTTAGTVVFSTIPRHPVTTPSTQAGTWTVGANSATGSAVPANAFYVGLNDGTNLVGSRDYVGVSAGSGVGVTANAMVGGLMPIGTLLNPYSVHLTTNTTTTPTSSTAYISSIVISNEVGGTTSTLTIQDKQGTPLKLVNGLATTALTTAPTVANFQTPVKMVSGIDIITAGAVAATVDVWINYYQ